MSQFVHSAEQTIQQHGTQPSIGLRSDQTRAEGWRFGRSRGLHPSKEGQRPRGATVGDATFGHQPKVSGPAESRRRSSTTMPSPMRLSLLRRLQSNWHRRKGEGIMGQGAKAYEAASHEWLRRGWRRPRARMRKELRRCAF